MSYEPARFGPFGFPATRGPENAGFEVWPRSGPATSGAEAGQRDATDANGVGRTPLRILLIEDNPSDAFLVHEYLAEDPDFDYDLVHVESLAEARAAVRRGVPDIALIDLSLPDGRGLDTFDQVRSWGGDFPVVVLSGLDDKDVALAAVRQGAQDYLPKNEINGLILTRVLRYSIERSRTERAIAARERRWRAMIERSSDVVSLIGPDLRLTYVSESVRESTGFSPDRLIGENVLEFVHPDDHEAVEQALRGVLMHESSPPLSYRFKQRDGGWSWREAVATNLLDDPAVGAIVVNARDIGERKLAEAEAARQKRILQVAIDAMPGVFYLFDDTPRFVLWNRNLEKVTGRSAAELGAIDPAELVKEPGDITSAIRRAFREGSAAVDGHLIAADGTEIPYHFTGRRFMLDGKPYAVGMGLDMTERVDLEERRAMLESVVVNARDAVLITDTDLGPDGQKIHYANPAFLGMTGYSEEEVLGNTPRMLQGPQTDRVALDEIRASLEAGEAVRAELLNYAKDGREYLIETDIVPVAGTDGATKRFIAVQRDITDRKRAEHERKVLLEQLGERVKELKLLHEASLIFQDEELPLGATFDRIVACMPSAWRFSSDTAARVRYREPEGSYEAASPDFKETVWMQSAAFETNAPGQGVIEVAYLGESITGDEGPFLPEEAAVIESLTQMLRAYLDRRHGRQRNEVLTTDLSGQLSRVAALQKISEVTLSGADLSQTLEVILEQATSELGVDAADVLLFDPDSQMLDYAASAGFRTNTIEQTSLRLGEGMGGKALLQRKPIAISDISEPGVAFEPADLIDQEGFVSYYAIPLIAKGQIQGLLAVFHRERLEFSREWRDVASDIARQAAIAIDNASLFMELQRSNLDLQLSYDRTIEGWARALDLKDEETAGHSQRVTRLAVAMAKKLGMSGEDLANIRRGALLHDIGKMGIPDDILLKPGKLDADEWEIMQRHTTYARDFLAGIPFLERALDIPYAHHEKWDGSGYPRGLRGSDIPLAARIFAVVDVYDALTSERPYRPAWSPAEAREYVRRESEAHFDPRVVDAFLELLDETSPLQEATEGE